MKVKDSKGYKSETQSQRDGEDKKFMTVKIKDLCTSGSNVYETEDQKFVANVVAGGRLMAVKVKNSWNQ